MLAYCPFCQIVAGVEPAEIVKRWDDAVAFVPLNPVTPGHLLVVSVRHVSDALVDPDLTGAVMRRAAELPDWPCNLITSVGAEATQSIFHLHVHVVPRQADDELALPWSEVR